jgi:type I restriction enzyme M protein
VREVFEDAYNYMKSGQLMRQVVNKISGIDFNNLSERQHFGDIYEQVLNDLQSAGNAGEYYTPRAVTAFMTDRIDPRPGELLFDPACGTGGFLTCAIRHMRDRYVKKVEDEREMQGALRAVEKKQLPHMLCVTNMLLHGIEIPGFVRRDNTLGRPYVSYTASDRVDIVLTNPPFGGREEDGIESNFPAHFRTRETADLFLALIIRLLKRNGRAAVVLPDGSLFGEGVKTRLKEHLLEECNLHTIVRLPNSVFKPYASIGTNLLFFEKGEPTKEIWFYEHRVPEGQKAYSMTKPIRVEHFKPCVDWWGGKERKGRVENENAWRITVDEVKTRGYNLDIKNPHTVAADHGNPEELLARLDEAERQASSLRDQLKTLLREALVGSPGVELIDAFLRTRETGEGTVLEVAVVEWHGPHEPGLCWEEYQSWVGTPTDGEVKTAQLRALADPEFFKQCGRCGERCNVGNMHDDTICQGCAERYLGVVH